MTDQELLELAAKAAGVEVEWSDITECFWGDGDSWVPLNDDGDALRLAVQLKMHVGYSWDGCNEEYDAVIVQHGKIIVEEQIGLFNLEQINETAATRRAIVRAAAEIGKEMK